MWSVLFAANWVKRRAGICCTCKVSWMRHFVDKMVGMREIKDAMAMGADGGGNVIGGGLSALNCLLCILVRKVAQARKGSLEVGLILERRRTRGRC